MIFDHRESYVFEVGNKNNLINNLAGTFFTSDCTVLVRFKPDIEEMKSRYDEHNRYVGCVVGKNGHHMGLMTEIHTTAEDDFHVALAFEYWEFNSETQSNEIRQIKFYLTEEDFDEYLDVTIKRKENKFIVEFKGEVKEGTCENLADYSFSMLWIGAANRIVEDHNHIFYGDIDKLHLQETYLDDQYCKLFFNDYYKFLSEIGSKPEQRPIFSGDFKDITPYRIKDLSNNGNHPIIFRKEWMM